MINTLLYYKPYILKHSRIYPLDKNREFRSAVINLIEPIYSNYKPMEAYNLDISLPLNKPSKPWMHYILLNLHLLIYQDSPYFYEYFKKPEPKQVSNQKNSGIYITDYIYNMQIIIIFTKKIKIIVAQVNYII